MATRRRRSKGVTHATLRRLALALPGAEEGTSYGTPAWKVRGKLFARLREDGDDLVVKVDFDERDLLMKAKPEVFHITDHYAGYEMLLVRLSAVDEAELAERLASSWRRAAPRRMVAAFDAEG